MGDRTWSNITVSSQHMDFLEKLGNVDEWFDTTAHLSEVDAGGSAHHHLELIAARIPFYGCHGHGVAYDAYRFAYDGRRFVEVPCFEDGEIPAPLKWLWGIFPVIRFKTWRELVDYAMVLRRTHSAIAKLDGKLQLAVTI